jgi:hypothetical protein
LPPKRERSGSGRARAAAPGPITAIGLEHRLFIIGPAARATCPRKS